MKRNCTTILFSLLTVCALKSQIVITEISYNPPESGTDSLEYIEIYNNSDVSIDLTNYSFTAGVDFTFPSISINPGEYMVTGVNADAMQNVFGVSAMQWSSGGTNNGGELIQLSDNGGNVIDEVAYDDMDDWPTVAEGTDGEGASIELCDVNSDNSLGTSWRAADFAIGITINGKEVKGSPGSANTVVCTTPADYIISAEGIVFVPADLTINVGETVRWENNGGLHNVNGDQSVYPGNPESFSNGPVSTDPWTFDFTFTLPGTYDYQCDEHVGLGMVGTITVEEEMVPAPNLVITEIFYNDPGNPDSLDFIEVINNEGTAVDMTGYYFSGVDYIFPPFTLDAGAYVIIAGDSLAIKKFFDVDAFQYSEGLSSAGELVELFTPEGTLVDMVNYLDGAPWPTEPDGFGFSLTLCNVNSDNNDASNWQAASTDAGFEYMSTSIFANPGSQSYCSFDNQTATSVDANGVSVLNGSSATLQGVVYGINFRPDGLQFVLIDGSNEGISLFSNSESFGYSVTEGDELKVLGTIDQFNGLIQIVPDTLMMVSNGNTLFNPTIVTGLGEDTESQLVSVVDVSVLNPAQWTNTSSGFNVEVGNATDTITIRIDADTDIFGKDYPSGTFTVTGLGGQFDNSSPFLEGYQLLPRYLTDIDPYVPFVPEFPFYDISTVTSLDNNGVADSIDISCEVIGVVHGINFRPSGLQFTIIDEFGDGMGVFNNTGDLGYTVEEGDEISVKGIVKQFNGLTQMDLLNSVDLLDTGLDLEDPIETDELNEDTESQLIKISKVLVLEDGAVWPGDGSSFNINVVDVSDPATVFVMRVDGDVDLSTMPAPDGAFLLTGIGGQFDSDSPFDSGYQIFPRYSADIDPTSPTIDLEEGLEILIYPNPANNFVKVDSDLNMDVIEIFDPVGRKVMRLLPENKYYNIDISELRSGLYHINIIIGDKFYSEQIFKM